MVNPKNRQPRKIINNFQFSQSSLQAFVDCPRLFQLRYIERLSWPALETGSFHEYEHYVQLGLSFHQKVQQYYIEIDPDRLKKLSIRDRLLKQWWENFIQHKPDTSGYFHNIELSLSIPIDEFRLIAKYDLLVQKEISPSNNYKSAATDTFNSDVEKPNFIIFDWKTSRNYPNRKWLESKLQTCIYPYILVKAGGLLTESVPVTPDQIRMVYWFSNFPTNPIEFDYSQEKFKKDECFILGLIQEIKKLGDNEAPKTDNKKRCQYCVYRSLCNRGVKAGSFDDFLEESELYEDLIESELPLEFDQIAEIEF